MAKILVIDDDVTIRMLVNRYLSYQGHTVEEADNGKTGLTKLASFDPDLVITDILMPEMDGFEILMEIRKHDKKIPIIAMSGGMRNTPIDFLQQAKMMGAQYVFKKPVGMDVLLDAINELLAAAQE